jgi:hypothetical protein
VHPNPDLVLEIETDPTAWVLQDADSAFGYLTRFVDPTANGQPEGDSDSAARRSILFSWCCCGTAGARSSRHSRK